MNPLDEIKLRLPKNAEVTKIMYEGPNIVVYTKNTDFLLNGSSQIKELIKELRKRINIRPDESIVLDPETSKKIIEESVPEEAGVKEILFEPDFGKVLIFARKPGLVIGKDGELLKKIREKIKWAVEIHRIPTIESHIVNKAREIVHEEAKYRKTFLNKIGSKIQLSKGTSREPWARLSFLGAAREVGRSAILLQTKKSNVLLDCGTGMSSNSQYPAIDVPEFNIEELDAVVISHAHLDHSGFVPYLYEYGYKGPVYSTAPTRDLMTLLQLDYIDVMKKDTGKAPYTSKGVKEMLKHSITLDYNEVFDLTPDMRLTFQNAGHILGSALSHIHIGEGFHNFLYTADLKFGPTKLLEPAHLEFSRIESMLLESTYGGPQDFIPPKREADEELIKVITETIKRKGKVVIPVFSVGRAQEVMVVLAEYANNNPEFNTPVYLDGMIWDATAIHTTYPEFLSRRLQKQIFHYGNNPFVSEIFNEVKSSTDRKNIIDSPEPAIILTTSGMITGGPVIEYMRHLAEDEKNTIIFIGFQAQGTLGSKIQKGWKDIPIPDKELGNRVLRINMEVKTVEGFSGHSDRNQLVGYVGKLKSRPKRIFINHGEKSKSLNLAHTLHKIYNVETYVPRLTDASRID